MKAGSGKRSTPAFFWYVWLSSCASRFFSEFLDHLGFLLPQTAETIQNGQKNRGGLGGAENSMSRVSCSVAKSAGMALNFEPFLPDEFF